MCLHFFCFLLQYKAWKEQILSSTPKEEQKMVIKRLKDEQVRKLQMLGEQYEQSIADMLQKQSVSWRLATLVLPTKVFY